MTATGCNKWKSLFSVGEEFDDEDLLDADWTTAAKSTSDRPASTSATVSLESSRAEHSTNVLGSVRSLLIPKCSTTCHLSTLRTPTGSARVTSDVSITEKPPEVTFPPPEASRGLYSNQIFSPSSEPLRVPQTPQPQDEFDDWDVDLEELDKSVSQVTSHISPAKRLRLSEFSGADPGVSQNRFSMPQAQHSSTIQTPVCPSTPIHHLNPVRGTITPVSRFPSPVTPRPPFASPQCQLRTPCSLRPRGSLFHAVSSAPTPLPTPRALNAPVLTNHLVQLVSAVTTTPQRSGSAMTRSKTRRFPGPAGALPDQLSTPQKVKIPHRLMDMESDEELSPREKQIRFRTVEKIRSLLTNPRDPDTQHQDLSGQGFEQQERIMGVPRALALEASVRRKEFAAKAAVENLAVPPGISD